MSAISQSPRVGVVLSGEGMPIRELVDYAVGLEDAGFDSVWHEEIFRDPFVPLAAIGARTSRLKLGTAVSTWVRTPVSSALISANLDELSDGRYIHGVGTGPPAWNEQFHGIPYHQPVDRMREYVGAIRTAWSGHSGRIVHYEGEHYSIDSYSRPIGQARGGRDGRSGTTPTPPGSPPASARLRGNSGGSRDRGRARRDHRDRPAPGAASAAVRSRGSTCRFIARSRRFISL